MKHAGTIRKAIYQIIALVFIGSTVFSAPSAKLQAALDMRIEYSAAEKKDEVRSLQGKIMKIISKCKNKDANFMPKISIEYIEGQTLPPIVEDMDSGTVNQLLNNVADKAGYELQIRDNWLNFIPKSKGADKNYVMNRHMPGTVVVSRESSKGSWELIKAWFASNNISCCREIRQFDFKSGNLQTKQNLDRPEVITLENPTLREYCSAYAALYDEDIWTVSISSMPAKDGKSSPRRVLKNRGF
jgi:hypothetical protein